jgi:hypothetical protein
MGEKKKGAAKGQCLICDSECHSGFEVCYHCFVSLPMFLKYRFTSRNPQIVSYAVVRVKNFINGRVQEEANAASGDLF